MDEIIEKIKDFFLYILDVINYYVIEKFFKGTINKIKKIKIEQVFIFSLIFGATLAAILPTINLISKSMVPKNGIFRCYYNEEGVLMQENSADPKYKKAKPAKDGVCIFKMADDTKVLQVTLVGGGGGGAASQIAQKQRSIENDPDSTEIDLVGKELEIINPFDKDLSDELFKEQVLDKIAIAVAGGGGCSNPNSNEASGMGGICILKAGTLNIGDKITRQSGYNGSYEFNGKKYCTDGGSGNMTYESVKDGTIELTARGGKKVDSYGSGNKNGDCSDPSYFGGNYRNESTRGSEPMKTKNQAFFNNFLVSKIVADKQKEKIKVIKGKAGKAGTIYRFKAQKLNKTLRICGEGDKGKCHAYVGKGGEGGIVKNKNSFTYSDNLSGANGGKTLFLEKFANGGEGGSGTIENDVYYMTEQELVLNGEDGKNIQDKVITNTGGNCQNGDCNATIPKHLGAGGGSGGLLYKTSLPFKNGLALRVLDAQDRQIGATLNFIENKEETYDSDERSMGNGGRGGSGAIIIKW